MYLAVRGTTCVAPRTARRGRALLVSPCAPASTASFSLKIERRFMRRVADRVRARESELRHPQKAVAPGPRCLGAFAEKGQPGATRPEREHVRRSGLRPRSVRKRVDLANDDDLEPTLVLPATAPGAAADGPHTDLEARLERLFTRGRDLAGTLIRPEVDILEMRIVAATEAHRRHILTMVSRLAQKARHHAARTGRARCVQPETLGSHASRGGEHPLGSRGGGLRMRPHNGVLFTHHRFSWRTFKGVFSSSALLRIKAKMLALEGLFRKLGPPRGETVARSCVEWWLLGCLAG